MHLLLSILLLCGCGVSQAVYVPTKIQIHGSHVTLKDIFNDLAPAHDNIQDKVVYQAPPINKPLKLSTRQLITLARKHKIAWRPHPQFAGVNIYRTRKTISLENLVSAIQKILPAQHQDTKITFWGKGLLLPESVDIEQLSFSGFHLDKASGQFHITVHYDDNGKKVSKKLQGQMHPQIKVPVLIESIRPGHIIQEAHIEWIDMPRSKVLWNHIREVDEIVGKTPRYPLKPGRLIRQNDIKKPVAVKKGALVNVIYTAPQIKLVLKAKALEGGAIGDTINLQGYDRKKIITAVITGLNTAEMQQG